MNDNWTSKPLGEVVTLQRGFDLPKKERKEGSVPIISSSGSADFHAIAAKKGPGVITGRYGTIGKVFYTKIPYWPLNTTLFVSNFHGNHPKYCYYLLSRFNFHEHSGKTGVPGVNRNDLHTVSVELTTDPNEQEAIAEALSDADALIEGLERLIAKKRLIKQGAMQKLLTGKRRLPGFSEEWENRKLGEAARIATGSRNNQDKDPMGNYPFFVRSDNVERVRTWSYDCEAVLVPGEGRIGEIFHYVNGKFDVHQRVYCISAFSNDISGRFIHALLRQFFGKHAMTNTVKATVDSLRRPTFTEFSFLCPPSLEEQNAIADVLTDIDAEIQALDTRLEKARKIKEGMMQNLLTGRIRLV